MKILGLDLGTNSIGATLRDDSLSDNQFDWYGVTTFNKGVGVGKSGEFSYAAERTKNRSVRRLNQARKYRLWATLEVLIINGYCPITIDDLDKWRKYDKKKGLLRQYPVENSALDAWIKLDFNGDGKPDYTSPYELRNELTEKKLDLANTIDKYKLGRAFYHIAQRRGFKSSRKDKAQKETEETGNEKLKRSETKKESKFAEEFKKKFQKNYDEFKTIGSALYYIENQKERVRLEWIQHTIRKQFKDEIEYICQYQRIDLESDFYKGLVEKEKNKYNGAIFYQRPLRSQKGLIGKCTLEPSKHRCPISHPSFEEFRALSLLNNIQYRRFNNIDWQSLSEEENAKIFNTLFFRKSKPYFDFIEIRELLQKIVGFRLDYKEKTINYSDRTNVSACPVAARLREIFGDNWRNTKIDKEPSLKEKKSCYDINDIWHVLFSFEDEEILMEFASEKLKLNYEQIKDLKIVWNKLPDGYASLSLKAINNILPFLKKGLIYTEAVLLANMPKVLGEHLWRGNEKLLTDSLKNLISRNRKEKHLISNVNSLISHYKSLTFEERYGWKDADYVLNKKDNEEILSTIIESLGEKTWNTKINEIEKKEIINTVTELYQNFFKTGFEVEYINEKKFLKVFVNSQKFLMDADSRYYKMPHLLDTIKQFLKDNFDLSEKQLSLLYHPSQIDIYPPAKPNENDCKIYLQSPKTSAFKNPMAMRALHVLRKKINYLIETNKIDSDTRIVVEVARELNDSNKRWAIETRNKRKQEENEEFKNAIAELLKDPDVDNIKANPENPDDIDKLRLWYEQITHQFKLKKTPKEITEKSLLDKDWQNVQTELILQVIAEKDMVKKYRLWKEQGCKCIYTGNYIKITDLFNENKIDFEHTLPRSKSFDNSMANLTVCFADYNRNIKKNQLPVELLNYEADALINGKTYKAIKPRLENWATRIEEIMSNIEFWKKKSKQAQDKDSKDEAIRKRHLWQFELDYWRDKLNRFTIKEITSGFKHSQLVDTQIISKYAFHYLKTVFNQVDVQKGIITSEFRKIYNIQPKNEKKDRSTHSHHAIDAAVLTLIPTSAKREKILEAAYSQFENKKEQYHEKPYPTFKINHISQIEENILINNIAKDQTLTLANKIVRKRGRIVYLKDKTGQLILDENKKPIPKIAKGDCIRGQLHLDTFYGKIKSVQRDGAGKPKKDSEGNWIYEEKNDGFRFVIRVGDFSKIKKLEQIVDPDFQKMIEKQLNGRTLEIALKEGIYALDKEGKPVGNKIRHIRCWADVTNPINIKKQSYISKIEYKNYYFAANAENALYAYYWDGKSKERGFECLNLYQVANIRKDINPEKIEDYFSPFKELGRGKSKSEVPIYSVLKVGMKVLFFKESKEELKELNISEISKRLYIITRLYDVISGRLMFNFHLDARPDEELSKAFPKDTFGQKGKNGFSEFNFEFPWPRLLMSPGSFNFIVEGRDFRVTPDGKISLNDNSR